MCQFISAVVLKNGDVLSHPYLDSHSDLVKYFKLPDATAHHQHFAKVELTPVDWLDVSTWQWKLDADTAPGWWDDVKAQAESTLRARAEKMILKTGTHELIVDGCWIVGGDAVVRDIRSGWIRRVQDKGQLINVRGSATVQNVGDSATVRDVGGSATVRDVWDSATVQNVRGSAYDAVTLDASAKAHLFPAPVVKPKRAAKKPTVKKVGAKERKA